MSSLNSMSPVDDPTSVASTAPGLSIGHRGEVLKMGYLKKLKTMKKKYFVLRCESLDSSAKLEYYDSEKKFRAHLPPKRSISLKACFNINRRTDNTRHKNVIALYTKDDCFCIVLDSEEELDTWLKAFWRLQNGDDVTDGEMPKPTFEHVWKVEVANKGLGATRNISGHYHFCASGKTVSLVKILSDGTKDTLEFPLQYIRSFGSVQSFFYLEVGRNAVTGTGEIWMEAEDEFIAKQMNDAMKDAMKSKGDDSGSKHITRSASVSESSRPITMRRHNHSGPSVHDERSTLAGSRCNEGDTPSTLSSGSVSNLDSYCQMHKGTTGLTTTDTDGSALSRTGSVPYNFLYCQTSQRSLMQQQQPQCRVNTNSVSHPNQRRHSVSAVTVSTPGAAGTGCWASGCKGVPPVGSGTTGSGTTPLLTHHHQRTYSFPLSPLPPSTTVRRGSIGTKTGHSGQRASGTSLNSAHCSSAGRDRSDSLPSTGRVSSETHAHPHSHHAHHLHHRSIHAHFIPTCRPHSMYNRGISHSPPVGSSPVSPASAACSTDSAGSSLSIDEGDNWGDGNLGEISLSSALRYGASHPLTPESPIEEENCDEYAHWNGPSAPDSGVGDDEKVNNYMPMDRCTAALSLPIQQPLNLNNPGRKISPGRNAQGCVMNSSKIGYSPSHSSNMDMCSPSGTSPLDTPGNYMTMSPGTLPDTTRCSLLFNRVGQHTHTGSTSANHSRASSLAEETPDGYTPMMPGQTDDGYVDMDPPANDLHHSEMSPSSSCSVTSGTPSTDLRFSEYPLEKVNSYFTPSEEEEAGERPTRCYSVGSKPDSLNKKNRLDLLNQTDSSRVRAFSVGSRNAPGKLIRPLAHDLHATRQGLQAGGHFTPPSHHRLHQQQPGSKKSSSAPMLSKSLSGSPMVRQLHGGSHSSVEPMDDLMEMDFSPTVSSTSKSSGNRSKASKSNSRSKPNPVGDYLSMSPGDHDRLGVPGGPSHHSSQSSVASSYSTAEGMDISGQAGSPRAYEPIGPGSPPKTSVLRTVYSGVGRSPPDSSARSPPSRSTGSPRSAVTRMSCISELKPQKFPTTTPSPPIKQSLLATNNSTASMAAKMAKMAVSSAPYMDMNFSSQTSKPVLAPSSSRMSETAPYVEMGGRSVASKENHEPLPEMNEDYMDMSFKARKSSIPEDGHLRKPGSDSYVEMGWQSSAESDTVEKKNSIERQHSSASSTGNADDYMNMSGGTPRNRDRNQLRSQPINILQPAQQNRKLPLDTPPKIPPGFLPLSSALESQSTLPSQFSSLARNHSLKSSRGREPASTGGSASGVGGGLTTPTGTGSNSGVFPISLNSPSSPLGNPLLDNIEKVPADLSSGSLKLTNPSPYVEMTPAASVAAASVSKGVKSPVCSKQDVKQIKHDYVNYNPGSVPLNDTSYKKTNCVEDDAGDYAIMCPVSVSSKAESQRKSTVLHLNTSIRATSLVSSDKDLLGSHTSSTSDTGWPSSKPLTVSSLLGMNNLSPVSTTGTEPQNNLNSSLSASASATASSQLSSRLSPSVSFRKEKKTHNSEVSAGTVSSTLPSSPVSRSDSAVSIDGTPAVVSQSSQNSSPCPSPSSEAGACSREKKMSSGSDSSTASRDSQLLNRKFSTGNVSPSGSSSKNNKSNVSSGTTNTTTSTPSRRLSCPNKPAVSRQASLSGESSESNQVEDAQTPGTSLSRQTSSSSTSGDVIPPSAEKRSLSCSPVPSSVSPAPRPVEREINYASLDLRQGPDTEDSGARSPRSLKTQGSLSESQSSTSSPSPNPPGGAFTYAQIDFEKSEELRKASVAKNGQQGT